MPIRSSDNSSTTIPEFPTRPRFTPLVPRRRLIPIRWMDSLKYCSIVYRRNLFAQIGVILVTWVVGYTMFIRMVKGSDHPGNQFIFRRRREQNQLDPKLLWKARVLDRYQMHKWNLDPYKAKSE